MSPWISLVALLSMAPAATPQGPANAANAASIAPFVGEDAAVVLQVDLARWQAGISSRRILGKLADDPNVADVASAIDRRLDALKKAGATDLFLLVDPADMPGYPVAVLPLTGGADPRKVSDALNLAEPGSSIRWPKSEAIRGALVAGSAEALARLRDARPAPRPEVLAALASTGDAAVRIALIPSKAQRRAIEESFPTLPPQVGGGPIEVVTRGTAWASMAIATEPRATLKLGVRARDAETARGLRKVAQDALDLLAQASRSDPSMADLVDAIARMTPEVDGETVRLEADLEKATALVSVPILRARDAARRAQGVNNLKQIGLAMHNYLGTHKTFPPAFLADKEGKPLLSWRVMILPFLDEESLYREFHLDEAWDSPHNKALIARMPKVYASPGGMKALLDEGKTTYLAPRGPATVLNGPVGVPINAITDGTSNTILAVEAGDDLAVTWTRPDDWSTDPVFTIQGLFGQHPDGTNFLLADGGVRFLKRTLKPGLIQVMTTRNGGEVTRPDDH